MSVASNSPLSSTNVNTAFMSRTAATTSTVAAITVSNTTQSTDTSTGAIITTGGAAIAKNLNVGENLKVVGQLDVRDYLVGSRASPNAIVAGTGIAFSGTRAFTHWWVSGSGGVDISASPQIAAATYAGQRLKITGTSDADYVQLDDGNGLITGGQTLRLGNNSVVIFEYDGTNWVIESTNGLLI